MFIDKFSKMFLFTRWRACLIFLRHAHTHAGVECNYYKILGINPSASQAEIKAAYFELSKKHHPDRNQGSEESAKIFRLIKTAYEVLGSEKRRMQYDKEQIFKVVRKPPPASHYTDSSQDYKDDAERMHYQSRARQPFRRFTQGKTTFYDFDAWYEGHYGKKDYEEFGSGVNEPRQFKTYYEFDPTERKPEVYEKLKNTFAAVFYLVLILSGIRIGNTKKKT